MMKTVAETYPAIGLYLDDQDDREFWNNTREFYERVKDEAVDFLSPKQISWLEKVEKDLSGN